MRAGNPLTNDSVLLVMTARLRVLGIESAASAAAVIIIAVLDRHVEFPDLKLKPSRELQRQIDVKDGPCE
jgi:hypothetical protein